MKLRGGSVRGKLLLSILIVMLAPAAEAVSTEQSIDKIVVIKSKRIIKLIAGDQVMKHYRISLGKNSTGHKKQQGDSRTPEGRYKIDYRNSQSRFYLSLHINYPNHKDIASARRSGVSPGGDIFIHGQPNGLGALSPVYRYVDWTDGCIAVSNSAMDEIWRLVKTGTEVIIYP